MKVTKPIRLEAGLGNIKKRQYICFTALLMVTAMLVIIAYRTIKDDLIYYRRAEALFFSKEFSRAIPFYKLAMEAGLKRPDAVIHMGESYLATENFKEAVRVLEEFVRANPNRSDTAAMIHLADLYKREKEFEAAERLYKKGLERVPGFISVKLKLAEMLTWMKRYDEAIALYRAVLENNPKHRLARVYLARVLTWAGQFEQAIREYRKVLERSI